MPTYQGLQAIRNTMTATTGSLERRPIKIEFIYEKLQQWTGTSDANLI